MKEIEELENTLNQTPDDEYHRQIDTYDQFKVSTIRNLLQENKQYKEELKLCNKDHKELYNESIKTIKEWKEVAKREHKSFREYFKKYKNAKSVIDNIEKEINSLRYEIDEGAYKDLALLLGRKYIITKFDEILNQIRDK
jgi:molecular chaperone DnaK (HSP70)